MNNYDLSDIKEVLQYPPSYLLDFLPNRRGEKIILAYLNKSKENNSSPKTNYTLDETAPINTTTTTLDVTGSPLKVDLEGDETLVIEKDVILQQWSESENRHFPLPIIKARQYLNSKTNIKNREAVFVVSDGNNALKTILLGVQESSKNIFTCTINIMGFLPITHEKLSFPSMERSHTLLDVTKKCHINYLITFKYFIFGVFLQNVKKDCKYNGSICIQFTRSTKCDLDKPSSLLKEVQLFLQVIAGHKNSMVYFLWEELTLLQSYIDVADDYSGIGADTVISNNSLVLSDIHESLKGIIPSNLIKMEDKTKFDLTNIRTPNIADKLWDVLKHCRNLDILRSTFHHFFEELAESDCYNKVPPGNDSNVATIINGIIDGKLAVPTISYRQALEFLFELGSEKLKNDYQIISKHFYAHSYSDISNKWNQLQKKIAVEGATKKTRITQCFKSDQTDIKACKAKLSYLGKLHVAIELIYLIQRQTYLPEATFNIFCTKVFEKYVAKESFNLEFKDIQKTPLCDFDMVIRANSNDIVAGRLPDFCSVRLKSVVDHFEAETVFVMSKYSIVPPTIYDDFDVENAHEEMHYYTYKLQSHNEMV